MSKPFSDIDKDMEILSVRVANNAHKLMKEGVVASGSALASKTPIDTGRASGNWQASASIPITSESEQFFPESSIAQIMSIRDVKTGKNTKLYLTNNVPYINRLNMGWSQQQPSPFWIERTVNAVFKAIFSKKFELTAKRFGGK